MEKFKQSKRRGTRREIGDNEKSTVGLKEPETFLSDEQEVRIYFISTRLPVIPCHRVNEDIARAHYICRL